MEPWFTLKRWATERFGRPLYRIPLDPGWGCPHRRPGEREEGCSFCAEDSGRARQLAGADTPAAQVEQAVAFTRERYGEGALQLYVQAYTATYATTEALQRLVEPLLERHPFVSLSLGTRPDCLPPKALDLLERWSRTLDTWVELGLQSSHDRTLRRVNRRHTWSRSREAVKRLSDRGVGVCAHLLFGLPGESGDDMFETLERVVALPVSGLKFHNLHLLRGTPLGREWERTRFPVMDEGAWLELAAQLIRRTPADLPLFRLFTDSPAPERLAPPAMWSKGRFLTELAERMRERGWYQGERFHGP